MTLKFKVQGPDLDGNFSVYGIGDEPLAITHLEPIAHILAASPELFQSVKANLELHGKGCGCGWCLFARAAVEKAEGGINPADGLVKNLDKITGIEDET